MKRICTDEFGTEWFEISKLGFVTQRIPAQIHSRWMQSANYSFKGTLLKTQVVQDISGPDLKRVDGIIVMGWTQVCNIETFVHWGLCTREEAEAQGFKLRY